MVNEKWHLVVSFKTELLSEYLIHKGYREELHKLIPRIGIMKNRMILDNDIYVDLNEIEEIQKKLSENFILYSNEAYNAIQKQANILLNTSEDIAINFKNSDTNKKLSLELKRFFKEYQKSLGAIGIPTTIDLKLEREILTYLEESKIKDVQKAFLELAVSNKPIETNKEYEELLDIAIKIQDNKLSLNSQELMNLVNKHCKKYGWIHSTLFLGDIYDEEKIINELESIKNPREIKEKLLKQREAKLQEANKIIKMISSNKGKEEAKFLQKAVYFRTVRLEWMNKACFIIRPILEESVKRLDIKFEDILYITPDELIESLEKEKLMVRKEVIKEREKGYGMISDNQKEYIILTGNELMKLKKIFSKHISDEKIIGIIASKGKIKGKVVIVKDRSELYKVKKDDILVTPLTTPDFVIAMKKASAIITDLGGVTSHAAIVARELRKPCIVGTTNATKVLKDGDIIEINDENGEINIIKKSILN